MPSRRRSNILALLGLAIPSLTRCPCRAPGRAWSGLAAPTMPDRYSAWIPTARFNSSAPSTKEWSSPLPRYETRSMRRTTSQAPDRRFGRRLHLHRIRVRPAAARRRAIPIVAGDVRTVSSQQRCRISDVWRAIPVHARQSNADGRCDRKAKDRAVITVEPDQTASLEREIAKLRKINAALMSRVERSTDQQLNAFSLFETAISLGPAGPPNRTQQLKQALQSLEKTNGSLSQAKLQAEAASSLKSSVLISVTHDLLQPLNAARLTLSALEEMIASPKEPY